MGKGLEKILEQKKSVIIKKWFDLTAQTYAPDTAEFIKGNSDPFANPVGTSYLDPVIRIRAVQNFTPSQATAFILSLKRVLRENLTKELRDSHIAAELIAFESKIDQLCLMAFDIYMQCREKIIKISANEMRNRTYRAFERAGLISETSEGP
jgi:hypothetical protein